MRLVKGLLLMVSLFLAGCNGGIYSATLISEGDHLFESGTHLPGDVFIRAGSAEFAAGSRVDGSIYIIGGALLLNGDVGGDVAVLDGDVILGPQTVIGRDLRLGGGTLEQAETAVIQGQTISNVVPITPEEVATAWDDRLRVLSAIVLLAILGGLWAGRRPQPLKNVGQAAVEHWLVSGAVGLLIILVMPILLVIMAFTIILLPLVMLLAGLLLLLIGYGFVALGHRLGGWLVQRSGRKLGRGWTTFLGTLMLLVLFNLPLFGEILLAVTIVLLLGALLLTRFGTRSYSPPIIEGGEEDLSTYGRPSPAD
jgi:hypothetical protein